MSTRRTPAQIVAEAHYFLSENADRREPITFAEAAATAAYVDAAEARGDYLLTASQRAVLDALATR